MEYPEDPDPDAKAMEDCDEATCDEDTCDEATCDEDTCDMNEIERLFPACKHWSEHTISEDGSYVLHISATADNNPHIAVSLSDYKTDIFSLGDGHLAKLESLGEHTSTVVDVKFSPSDCNLLYTGSSDGSIRLWDVRTPKKSSAQFTDTTVEDEKSPKVFTSFDVSPNNRVLCAGTELFESDAFIIFWDIRNLKILGGYWESHTDDITQLRFHHSNSDRLISGSTDGLINVYNLKEVAEEDALVDCLNTESSVETLDWFNNKGKDGVSCVTHVADVQLWNADDVQPYSHFRRGDIAKALKKQTEDYVYIANVHSTKQGLLLLAGSNAHQGECFRGFQVKKDLHPAVGFPENKQRVRTSWYNKNTGLLLTGGEMGIVNTCTVTLTGNS